MNYIASFLTIVNRDAIFEEFKSDLLNQSVDNIELIKIDNTKNEYSSARQAYNDAAIKASGKYLIFSHPDIRFLNKDVVKKIIEQIEKAESFGVIGIAGAKQDKGKKSIIITSIVHGSDKHTFGDERCLSIEEVQTVDECLFVVKREYFLKNPFPVKEGWHLYAVEYCLDCIMNGESNYVIPAEIWHMSEGKSLDEKYVEQIEVLIKERKKQFDTIYTTIKTWRTRGTSAWLYRKYYWLKQRIKRMIVRR